MRFFRSAWFTVPNVVAFCTYFATFAIFFFTALYLDEVVSDSGYRIALVFAPMTVLMIVASVLRRLLDRPGRAALADRRSAAPLFAAGLLLTNPLISAHPNYLLLALTLAVAGIGIGITVVPVTSTVLNAVPARALRDGGLGHQHQPRDRRGHRRRGPRRARVLAAQRLPNQPPRALNVPASEKALILGFKSTIIPFIETGQATASPPATTTRTARSSAR